jgi:uncharacterized protein (UPF0332 family)
MAHESFGEASSLFDQKKFHSTISRAYYAVYAKVTHELISIPMQMPKDRKGPSHQKLRSLVIDNLKRLENPKRETVARMVRKLYELRIEADYRPTCEIGKIHGRQAIALMKKAFSLLS